ncbi:MAG: signal recognition particle protein [Muribaculaceae bacterium]|nr:signal recognition particle protein [Muribaculaceae bacterium]
MFESLNERLERSFKILKGEGKITEINVAQTMKDVRKALMEADVSYKVAKEFTDTVKKKAMGQQVLTSVKPKEMMVKIMHDELAALMGGERKAINLNGRPAVIMMAGLNGAGKTTFSGKLAAYLKQNKSRKPLLVAADVHRPAAMEQLKVLADQIGVPVYMEEGSKDAVAVSENGVKYARTNNHDVVIIDTAGRLAINEELMQEIEAIRNAVDPQEILFVVDSMTGQDAVNTAKIFHDRLNYDGVVMTKLDGDTRGGAALSIRSVVDKPIKFVGTGEKMGDIQEFNPEGMADRILGMGDIVSLVEKAQQVYDEKEAQRLADKLARNKFDFDDFYGQIQQIKKMGNLKDLASMIPGLGKVVKNIDIDDNAFKGIEAIILSMTKEERANPEIIKGTRVKRIAEGSGTSLQEVNKLIKQFMETRKMMRGMTSKSGMAKMSKMAQLAQMKGKMPKMPF